MTTVKDCFVNAQKDEEKGKKHKGLLFVGEDNQKARPMEKVGRFAY